MSHYPSLYSSCPYRGNNLVVSRNVCPVTGSYGNYCPVVSRNVCPVTGASSQPCGQTCVQVCAKTCDVVSRNTCPVATEVTTAVTENAAVTVAPTVTADACEKAQTSDVSNANTTLLLGDSEVRFTSVNDAFTFLLTRRAEIKSGYYKWRAYYLSFEQCPESHDNDALYGLAHLVNLMKQYLRFTSGVVLTSYNVQFFLDYLKAFDDEYKKRRALFDVDLTRMCLTSLSKLMFDELEDY